jgi:hypothetical protein
VRALAELVAEARQRGWAVEVLDGAPAYLADAAAQAPSAPNGPSAPSASSGPGAAPRGPGRLVLAPGVAPVAAGDWLVADLPLGGGLVPARRLAAQLAQAGAQAYELLRLPGGRAALVARGVAAPEAVSPLLKLAAGGRGRLEAAPAASGGQLLALANLERLAAWQAEASLGVLLGQLRAELDEVRFEAARLERIEQALRSEVAAYEISDERLRARVAEVTASPFFRLGRKLGHWRRRAARLARQPRRAR